MTDPSQFWAAQLESGEGVRFRLVPPGRYRLVSGTAEQALDVAPGDQLTVDITRAAPPAGADHDMRVTGTHRTGYGTRFDRTALELLPESGSVYGLIERSDPLVVTDLIEGGGTFLEPQRLGASGASWTQTSFRFGEADVTDPDRTGFAMIYPNLDTLQAVSVTTAGLPVDGYGSGTSVMLVPRTPASSWQRSVEFHGSPPAFQSVNPLPAAASIARLRAATGASFVASGPVSDRLGILLAGGLARSTRLERERLSPLESRAHSLSAHLVYKATARAPVCAYSRRRTGCRYRLSAAPHSSIPAWRNRTAIDAALRHVESRRARRSRVGRADLVLAHASSSPALSRHADPRKPWSDCEAMARPTRWRQRRAAAGAARRSAGAATRARCAGWGSRRLPEFGASVSWTGVTRDPPGHRSSGSWWMADPRAPGRITTDGERSRWSGLELAFWATPGGRRASLILEVYNLLNTNNEVEEDEVSGPAFRDPTAVQPPRSVRLGLRVTFRLESHPHADDERHRPSRALVVDGLEARAARPSTSDMPVT